MPWRIVDIEIKDELTSNVMKLIDTGSIDEIVLDMLELVDEENIERILDIVFLTDRTVT